MCFLYAQLEKKRYISASQFCMHDTPAKDILDLVNFRLFNSINLS